MNAATGAALSDDIFNVTEKNFSDVALKTFRFQYSLNKLYRQYCDLLKTEYAAVTSIGKIPFLPIGFFKTHHIKTGEFEPGISFESSGTTGSVNSRHPLKDKAIYEQSFLTAFRQFYGNETDWCIIGLLPSYLERNNSSLVYMVNELIKNSAHPRSGFYLNEYDKLKNILLKNEAAQQQTLLIGVTYALLDLAEQFPLQLQHTIIMETGGMKGRREELSRATVHAILQEKTGVKNIHSEYGMTELLSQAYSKGEGIFHSPPWMKILLRSEDDPFEISGNIIGKNNLKRGAVNIIDLANLYSCSFIATDDAGILHDDGSFEITGRLENSDVRGCSLMYI